MRNVRFVFRCFGPSLTRKEMAPSSSRLLCPSDSAERSKMAPQATEIAQNEIANGARQCAIEGKKNRSREFRITRSPGDLLRLTPRQVAGQCNSFAGDADGKRLPGLQARAPPTECCVGRPFRHDGCGLVFTRFQRDMTLSALASARISAHANCLCAGCRRRKAGCSMASARISPPIRCG